MIEYHSKKEGNIKQIVNKMLGLPSSVDTALRSFFLHFSHEISTFKTVLCAMSDTLFPFQARSQTSFEHLRITHACHFKIRKNLIKKRTVVTNHWVVHLPRQTSTTCAFLQLSFIPCLRY
jgi:hypothetical protein